MDRFNIGFAQQGMASQLGIDTSVYGFASGIFFVGYMFASIPTNLLLSRFGARRILAATMLLWGITSSATAFVTSPTELIWLRTLLGLFEGGYYPGVILFLSYWYGPDRIGRITAIFTSGFAVSSVVGSPLSGLILKYSTNFEHLAPWQWLFLVEGLPTCFLSILVFIILRDNPTSAEWMSKNEREAISSMSTSNNSSGNEAEEGEKKWYSMLSPQMFSLGLLYFLYNCGAFSVYFWAPKLLRDKGIDDPVTIGVIMGIFSAVGVVSMIASTMSSDRMKDRRHHFAIGTLLAAAAIIALPLVPGVPLTAAVLLVCGVGLYPGLSIFWTIPSAILGKKKSPLGIAVINFAGISSGFISPVAIGWATTQSGSLTLGMVGSGVLMAGCAVVAMLVIDNNKIFKKANT
jgi:MFS family permease